MCDGRVWGSDRYKRFEVWQLRFFDIFATHSPTLSLIHSHTYFLSTTVTTSPTYLLTPQGTPCTHHSPLATRVVVYPIRLSLKVFTHYHTRCFLLSWSTQTALPARPTIMPTCWAQCQSSDQIWKEQFSK